MKIEKTNPARFMWRNTGNYKIIKAFKTHSCCITT